MEVQISFTEPGSIVLDVNNPENEEECVDAFVEHINKLDEKGLVDILETEAL